MKKNLFLFICGIFLILSCASESELEKEIAAIPVEVDIERFDRVFAEATPENLPEIKREYPYLFPAQYADSVWIAKTQDTLQKELEREVEKAFPNLSPLEDELESLFQHLKYYFPEFKEPKVITVISDVDYRNSVVAADSLLFIGLDNYLGKDHHFYGDIPRYFTNNFNRDQITPDIAEEYAEQIVQAPASRTFLAAMIYYGKIHYTKQLLLPGFSEDRIIAYTEEELDWARANEDEIWRYFIERELLYSTDPQMAPRFINPAPFSKFYLELDNESPGRLGQYMGWQIVQAYAKNNDATLNDILRTPAEEIFNNSRFKPRK